VHRPSARERVAPHYLTTDMYPPPHTTYHMSQHKERERVEAHYLVRTHMYTEEPHYLTRTHMYTYTLVFIYTHARTYMRVYYIHTKIHTCNGTGIHRCISLTTRTAKNEVPVKAIHKLVVLVRVVRLHAVEQRVALALHRSVLAVCVCVCVCVCACVRVLCVCARATLTRWACCRAPASRCQTTVLTCSGWTRGPFSGRKSSSPRPHNLHRFRSTHKLLSPSPFPINHVEREHKPGHRASWSVTTSTKGASVPRGSGLRAGSGIAAATATQHSARAQANCRFSPMAVVPMNRSNSGFTRVKLSTAVYPRFPFPKY
jgi:hypothetical protein